MQVKLAMYGSETVFDLGGNSNGLKEAVRR